MVSVDVRALDGPGHVQLDGSSVRAATSNSSTSPTRSSTRTCARRTLAAEDMPGARDESGTVSESSLTPAVPSGQVGAAIRGRFPVFRDKVYVNSCSQGALSDAVRAAYAEYLDGWDENGAEWDHWVERSEAARTAFAALLGAAPDDVAIQTSVSAAVSGLVSSLQFRGERNRIVISANEFPTIGQIAQTDTDPLVRPPRLAIPSCPRDHALDSHQRRERTRRKV